VQCCISKTTVDKFVDFLETTYNLAVQYKNTASGKKSANELVMEWLRHEKYDGLTSGWTTLIGGVDGDWINFAKGKKHAMFDQFADPHFCGQAVETDHLGASMNAVLRYPPLAYPYVNRGDFGGWGGDLSTLYAEWSHAGKPSRSWVKDMIIGNAGSFKLLDAIEDADAFNMGVVLSNLPARAIHEIAKEYYKPKGGYRTRFSAFHRKRFTDREHARTLAREMLTGPGNSSPGNEDAIIPLLRTAAIKKDGILTPLPSTLSAAELASFLDGFVDALEELAKDKGKEC
tara:strand:- start:2075 stop:2935 length:861 start_codon:yes stop_codon:yes gene_type:complete